MNFSGSGLEKMMDLMCMGFVHKNLRCLIVFPLKNGFWIMLHVSSVEKFLWILEATLADNELSEFHPQMVLLKSVSLLSIGNFVNKGFIVNLHIVMWGLHYHFKIGTLSSFLLMSALEDCGFHKIEMGMSVQNTFLYKRFTITIICECK